MAEQVLAPQPKTPRPHWMTITRVPFGPCLLKGDSPQMMKPQQTLKVTTLHDPESKTPSVGRLIYTYTQAVAVLSICIVPRHVEQCNTDLVLTGGGLSSVVALASVFNRSNPDGPS